MQISVEPVAFAILCDAVEDGILIFDGGDRVSYANAGARRLLRDDLDLIGLSVRSLLRGYLGIGPTCALRLRAGESLLCDAPDGRREAVRASWLSMPATDGNPPVGALVLHDLQPARRLRTAEDTLARLGATPDAGGPPGEPMSGPRILRYFAQEVRRARRDRDTLTVVVARVPEPHTADAWVRSIARRLPDPERVGLLADPSASTPRASDTTMASLPAAFNAVDGPTALVVAPCTSALRRDALRLVLSPDEEAALGRVGVASFDGGDSRGADGARGLLERAFGAMVGDTLGERRGRRQPAAA